jgi:isopentenyl phosphate kinase
MLTFVKFGGSLITDKRLEASFREDVVLRLGREIRDAMSTDTSLQVLIGHGSGSFGHFAAREYGTMQGVRTPDQWRGFAHVATTASELNHLTAKALQDVGLPVWRIQPSASALSHDGVIVNLAIEPIREALKRGIIPLVYGDVSLDEVRGGTIISTETIFFYLARHLPVNQILLLGEVEGVYDQHGQVIPEITPDNLHAIEEALGGSAGTDVTGGMETKVRDMVALTQLVSGLTIRIMNGAKPDWLKQTILGTAQPGTRISTAISG